MALNVALSVLCDTNYAVSTYFTAKAWIARVSGDMGIATWAPRAAITNAIPGLSSPLA